MAELSIISPVHIGNGNEFTLIDFIMENKNFINIDFDKVVDYCSEKNIKLAEEIEAKLDKFKMEEFFKKNHLNPEDFSRYAIPLKIDFDRIRQTKPRVREFIKDANKFPYVPGSSIKGAIRTAILWSALQDKDIFEYCDELYNSRVNPQTACKKLEQEIFGKDAHEDILRVLRISDTKRLDIKNLEVNEIKIIGNQESIPTYIESLKAGSNTNFNLWIDEKFLSKDMNKFLNIKNILKICNEFSMSVAEKQSIYNDFEDATRKFFTEDLKNNIKSCKENEAIFNIGWGGGWYSKTIGLKIEKYRRWNDLRKNRLKLGKIPGKKMFVFNFPKTRRVAIDGLPLGWVKVRV